MYQLDHRETCIPACTEHDFWAIRHSQPVKVDRLVSYPPVFFSSNVTLSIMVSLIILSETITHSSI